MDVVDYGDNDPWPVGADGSGASLAKIDEDWAASDVTNWRTSVQIGGTPGATNFPMPDLTPTTTKPVGLTSTWRYNDTGTDQGTAWREPNFVDSGWSQGPALFTAGTESTPALGLRYLPITGDADVGISSGKTYTHKLDFGSGDTGAVINGVGMTQVTSPRFASVPNFTWQTSSGATSATVATRGHERHRQLGAVVSGFDQQRDQRGEWDGDDHDLGFDGGRTLRHADLHAAAVRDRQPQRHFHVRYEPGRHGRSDDHAEPEQRGGEPARVRGRRTRRTRFRTTLSPPGRRCGFASRSRRRTRRGIFTA